MRGVKRKLRKQCAFGPAHEAPMKEKITALCLLGTIPFLAPAGTALAQTAPAVSGLNGKLSYAGGNMDSSTGHNFDGSFTFPVTHQTGFQVDGLYSQISDLNFYGGAGHFFWRDPKIGLAGLTGGYLYRDGVYTYQAGAEGQYYLGRFTFGAFAGVGSIKYANPAPFIDTNPTRLVGRVSADYYPLNDLRVGASYTTAFRENLVSGELEYQTPIRGLALTAEVSTGDYGYHDCLFGIRYYFGGNKTLRDRHRQDDPPGLMPHILQGLGVYGAEFNHKGNEYIANNPGSGSLGGSGGDYGVVITGGGLTILPPDGLIISPP